MTNPQDVRAPLEQFAKMGPKLYSSPAGTDDPTRLGSVVP